MIHFNEKLMIDDQEQLMHFLRAPTVEFAAGLTTILANPGTLIFGTGRIVQAAIKGRLFEQLGRELENLIEEGRIKEDYFATPKQQATLNELLKFIDENPPDEEVFNALKSIFFCAVEREADAGDEQRAYQFLQICKRLQSGEILLLRTCWKISQTDPDQIENLRNETTKRAGIPLRPKKWLQHMSAAMGLPEGLIDVHATHLLELRLFENTGADQISTADARLSSFGLELCEYITKY